MSNTYLDKIVGKFRKELTDSYELDNDIIVSIISLLRKAYNEVAPPTARRTRSKQKQRRKKSAYNMFVRVMMQDEDIKSLGHKNKMSAIGAKWTSLADEDKEEYKSMASDENERDEANVDADVTVSTDADVTVSTDADASVDAED